MDLRQIRYFLEVVDQGSINMAAHKLGMTQPPVSKQMQLLEAGAGLRTVPPEQPSPGADAGRQGAL